MNNIEKIMTATTLEQSRKLIELGISSDTADMHYAFSAIGGPAFQDMIDASAILLPSSHNTKYPYEPAWSLSALLELMPKVNGHYPDLCRGKETGFYYMWIEDVFDTQTFPNPIDAAFEMVCWLKENSKI